MRTPLYQKHVEHKARMVPFAGWDMPIQYTGIVAEHHHTRKAASIFDICHMGEFELSGPSAEADLERLITMSVSTIHRNQCRYGYLLRENGGVLDDLTCYRLGDERFMLVVNAGTRDTDAAWIKQHLASSTTFTDRSDALAKLDIQGPESREAMEAALGHALPDLKYFRCEEMTLNGVDVLLSRTGYTGEWGYELYLPVDEAGRFWDLFLTDERIQPAGLGARDTLRLEVGYPLYGHELAEGQSPVSASRGMFVDLSKDFIGKSTVERELDEGVDQVLVGLMLEGRRAARAGDPVMREGTKVGQVTSGSFAPSLGVAAALAYVDQELAAPGETLDISIRGQFLLGKVVETPMYRNGTARKKSSS
ncbi:MAG: glycine cleavage system aminomethyltransferase GcvT [Verrucomicrobiota bacterium]